MTHPGFPHMITRLPEADIPFRGVRGWISQAPDHQLVFMEIEPIGDVTPHRHGEQWGVVIEGVMELTIAGVTHRFGPGDTYHVPAGVEHGARFPTAVRLMDMFADVARYSSKRRPGDDATGGHS